MTYFLPVLIFGNCVLKTGVIKWPVKLYVRYFYVFLRFFQNPKNTTTFLSCCTRFLDKRPCRAIYPAHCANSGRVCSCGVRCCGPMLEQTDGRTLSALLLYVTHHSACFVTPSHPDRMTSSHHIARTDVGKLQCEQRHLDTCLELSDLIRCACSLSVRWTMPAASQLYEGHVGTHHRD